MSGYVLSSEAEFDLDEIWEYIAAVGAYLVIYRAKSRPIEIAAVTQGARDIPAFLSRRVRR